MELLWTRVNEYTTGAGVEFDGDPTSLSKAYPMLWRGAQNWHCIDFGYNLMDGYEEGYYLYRSCESIPMIYRRALTERYVMTRIGPESVSFWAKSSQTKRMLQPRITDIVIPSNWAILLGADPAKPTRKLKNLSGGIIWV